MLPFCVDSLLQSRGSLVRNLTQPYTVLGLRREPAVRVAKGATASAVVIPSFAEDDETAPRADR